MWTKAKYPLLAGIWALFFVADAVDPKGWIRGVAGCRPSNALIEVAWRQDQRDAFLLMDDERFREAEDKHRSALRLVEEQYGPEHEQVIKAINALGVACLMQGKLPEAEVLYLRALRLSEEMYENDDPKLCLPLLGLYQIAYERGRYTIAADYAKQRLEIAEAAFGESDQRLVDYLDDLSDSYEQQNLFRDAIPICERMVELLRERSDGAGRPLGFTLCRLAFFYQALGKYRDAEPLFLRSLEILGRVDPGEEEDSELIATVRNYSELLRATNRPAEAKALEERYRRN